MEFQLSCNFYLRSIQILINKRKKETKEFRNKIYRRNKEFTLKENKSTGPLSFSGKSKKSKLNPSSLQKKKKK